MGELDTLIKDYSGQGDNWMTACHKALLKTYPEIRVRWARIYGRRWSHILGDAEAESVSTLRVQLNDNYGICIDNGYLLSSREWEAIIETIKGYMAYEPVIL